MHLVLLRVALGLLARALLVRLAPHGTELLKDRGGLGTLACRALSAGIVSLHELGVGVHLAARPLRGRATGATSRAFSG